MTGKDLPKRKTIRLQSYDYSSKGIYHVTICTRDRAFLFGRIQDAKMQYSEMGMIAYDEARRISSHYSGIEVVEYAIMPNHVHLLIAIDNDAKALDGSFDHKPTLGQIVGAYKAGVRRRAGIAIWQPRFYEHIIRNEADYVDTIKYIQSNPLKWQYDRYNADQPQTP